MLATFGGATLGGAALGTAPSPVASGLSIRLAGAAIPTTWTADALRIAESVDQRAVCDLTLVARTGPARVEPGTRLDVRQGGVVLFTGTAERTVDAILPGSQRAVEIKLTAVDASQIADRRLITDRIDFALDDAHPTGWRADTIARTLVYSYLAGEGVTAFSTDCGSRVTAAFAFQTVASALTQLAEATGSFWKIGPTRDLLFGPRTMNLAPRTVTDSSVVEHVQVERTRERFRTEQTVTALTTVYSLVTETDPNVGAWTTVESKLGPTVITSTALLGSPSLRLRAGLDAAFYRALPLSTPTSLRLFVSAPTRVGPLGGTDFGPAWFIVAANAQGLGTAVYLSDTGSPRLLQIGVTHANCWTNVVTPSDLRSWDLAFQPIEVLVTSAHLAITASGTLIASGQIATTPTTPAVGTFAAPGMQIGMATTTVASGWLALDLVELDYVQAGFGEIRISKTDATAIASLQAIEGGTGRYQSLVRVEDSTVTSAQLDTTATALLRRFSTPPTILTFEDDTPGYRAGQLLPVSLSAFAIGDDMLIEAVDLRLDGGTGRLITRVQAVSDEQQGRVSDFWRAVAGAA